MSAIDRQVQEILARTLAHVDAIRVEENGEDEEANRKAHLAIAELFALGMVDRWMQDDGEEMPTPDAWEWNCEPLAPGEAWSDETRARFHRVCGDLNLLHSNDAGLNAAKDNYESAVEPLRTIDPVAAVLCYARLLRASAYASYGSDVLEEHAEGLAWAAGQAREAGPAVRDEYELSLVEMSRRLLSGAEADLADGKLGDLLRSTLRALCGRDDNLPYRRAVPWLVLAGWASTEMLAGDRLAPFLQLTGTSDMPALMLHAADRAEKVDDGAFYRNGGALSPDQYIEGTATQAMGIRIHAYSDAGRFQEAHDLAAARLDTLGEYDTGERIQLETVRLRALAELDDRARWSSATAEVLGWLEASITEYWWDMYGVPEMLEALGDQAARAQDAAVATRIAGVAAARANAKRDL